MKKNLYLLILGLGLLTAALMSKASAQSQTHTITISQVFTNTSATTWTVPVGVTSVTVQCYGGGGGGMQGKLKNDGGTIKIDGDNKPYGGGGGAYAASTFTVTAGATYYICAGAGGAAHLAGVTAAYTTIPVIGVPINGKAFGGMDALLATVQMPSGIPVATVAIDGAANAGILAAKMLAIGNPELLSKIEAYKEELKQGVMAKKDKIERVGYQEYMAN